MASTVDGYKLAKRELGMANVDFVNIKASLSAIAVAQYDTMEEDAQARRWDDPSAMNIYQVTEAHR